MTRVIIDAGHGGSARAGSSSAFGSRGPGGTIEKDITLDIARHVVQRLGNGAALTRSSDTNLTLAARAARAVQGGAGVFVSIHANSGPPDAAGPETFVHPEAGAGSHRLADGVQRALERLRGRYGGVAEPRTGAMAVLDPRVVGRATSACLVEVDYLSNPRAEQRLRDPGHRAAIGAAIADAIRDHVGHGDASRPGRIGDGHPRSREDPYIEPDVDYTADSLEDANRKWEAFFQQYALWRKGVPLAAYAAFPHAAICQLKLYAGSDLYYGTGFYIGPDKILSCGHNFKLGSEPLTTRVVVQPGFTGVTSVPEQSFPVNAEHVVPRSWWTSDAAEWDLAVIRTPGFTSSRWFSLPNMSPSGATSLVMCGYGKFRDGRDDETQGQTMAGCRASETRVAPDNQGWFVPILGIPGHSGSPVFSGTTVAGVFTRMQGPRGAFDPNYNYVVRLDPERLDWIHAH